MCSLRPHVLAAKRGLAEGFEEFRRQHENGCSGVELCAAICDARDRVILELAETALDDLQESGPNGLWPHIALVAHGGYGRRDVSPFSDVDLMILHDPNVTDRVIFLAERLLRDVFDAGMCLGHSVRTPRQACFLAGTEPVICTSLVESRLLRGSETLFAQYMRLFHRHVHRRAGPIMAGIVEDRQKERKRYGETPFLLEPNIKRSQGTLRDIQLIRWIGFVRYGTAKPAELQSHGLLSKEDLEAIQRASEFLLHLRNDLHFHTKQLTDVLDRAEQVRISNAAGYPPTAGILPVEQFMREYFRHTAAVSHIATQFTAKAQSHDRLARLSTLFFGHRVEDGINVGPVGLLASRHGEQMLRGSLTAIIRLVDLANLYDKPIAASTWDSVRRHVQELPRAVPSSEASRHFLSLLGHPARLGPLLHDLHDAHILERFIPEFEHARGLLQFNQYHKYTVDEHCLKAVDFAAKLWSDPGPLGRVYRTLNEKHLLHLALLIHDLGKGHLEDHREIGVKIATNVAHRLGLPSHEAESLRFLVHKHMLLNHLAFRRDTADEQLAVQFAVQVGSPKLLQMLYLMTAADLGAVGPDVWDGWKQEVVTDLYHRTMQHLAGESPETTVDDLLNQYRENIREHLGNERNDPWFVDHIAALPMTYVNATPPQQVAADLRLLRNLSGSENNSKAVLVASVYLAETDTVQFTIATSENLTPGIFHKITGVLTSQGLDILSAQIHTLSDGLVIDRFSVRDPDFSGEPPPRRLEEIEQSVTLALTEPNSQTPAFRNTWQVGKHRPVRVPGVPTRVNIDNSTSNAFTIIDIFTHDRTGLLYAITHELFELGLSVGRAKIGTFLDQVVDVFYVTDQVFRKIQDQNRLDTIRQRLLEVIEQTSGQNKS